MTVRNFITLATVSVFLAIVLHIVFVDQAITESPVLMFILGAFMSAVTMIYTFYYRKNPSQKSKPKDDYDTTFSDRFDDGICPCCGQEIQKV